MTNSTPEKVLTREFLNREYTQNKLSANQIAKNTGFCSKTIGNYIHKYGIFMWSENLRGNRVRDLSGKKFGHYTAINVYLVNGKYNNRWVCRCDCGQEKIVFACSLTLGRSRSCGHCHYRANYRGVGELSGSYFSAVRSSAKTRKIKFNITIENAWDLFIKQGKKCAISGEALMFAPPKKSSSKVRFIHQTASLDRIDSRIGYEIDNIQWVHKTINRMKNTLSDAELIEWSRKITEKNSKPAL